MSSRLGLCISRAFGMFALITVRQPKSHVLRHAQDPLRTSTRLRQQGEDHRKPLPSFCAQYWCSALSPNKPVPYVPSHGCCGTSETGVRAADADTSRRPALYSTSNSLYGIARSSIIAALEQYGASSARQSCDFPHPSDERVECHAEHGQLGQLQLARTGYEWVSR